MTSSPFERPVRPVLTTFALAFVLVLAATAPLAVAQEDTEPTGFASVLAGYEALRLTLVADSTDGVRAEAENIHRALAGLAGSFDSRSAAVAESESEAARVLIGELTAAAEALAAAEGLEAVRDAFYELSKPLVRYRELMEGERPVVAYCPMSKRSWLQPQGEEVGNPYHGSSMPKCGKLLS